MKKLALIVIALVFSSCTIAQPNTFEKIIDTLGCDYASCIKETFDGGYIIAGSSWNINNDVAIIKLDSLGNIQWAKTYDGGGMDGAKRVEQLPDSGYMVMGIWNSGLVQKTWLMRLNASGDTLWTNKISGGIYKNEPQGMATGLSNKFAITGVYEVSNADYDVYLLIADSMGECGWKI